jgi:plasmid stability protein
MTRLSIDLPDEVRDKLEVQAARWGHSSVEEFVQALLRAEAEEPSEDYGAPAHLTFNDDAELSAILRKRAQDTSPGIEPTAEFWESFRRRAAGRGDKRA